VNVGKIKLAILGLKDCNSGLAIFIMNRTYNKFLYELSITAK